MNLRWSERETNEQINKQLFEGEKFLRLVCNHKAGKIICEVRVSYRCRSVCPLSIWMNLRACSLPTPGMPLWKNGNTQLTQVVQISDVNVARFQTMVAPSYLRDIITAKKDGQSNKIFSGEV